MLLPRTPHKTYNFANLPLPRCSGKRAAEANLIGLSKSKRKFFAHFDQFLSLVSLCLGDFISQCTVLTTQEIMQRALSSTARASMLSSASRAGSLSRSRLGAASATGFQQQRYAHKVRQSPCTLSPSELPYRDLAHWTLADIPGAGPQIQQ